MPKGKVLAIQSHVVTSYVGCKSVTFVLQLNGFDVDQIYSVVWSNHTAYSHIYGHTGEFSDFHDIYAGLKKNHLNTYDYIVSGFIKTMSFASYLPNVVRDLKKVNPNLKFYFDPVLGDNGKFYCPEALLDLYRTELLSLADVTTPNQFEAEKLSGIDIKSKDDAIQACKKLHQLGAKTVVISSLDNIENKSHELTCVLSSIKQDGDVSQFESVFITFPKFQERLIGTGDTFIALLLASLHSKNNGSSFHDKISAVTNALYCMNKIIEKSLHAALNTHCEINPNKKYNLHELALADCVDIVQYKNDHHDVFDISEIMISEI